MMKKTSQKRRRCTDPEALALRAAYRKLRESAGCTRADIAADTGISRITIGNTEQGFVVSDDTWNRYWRAVVRRAGEEECAHLQANAAYIQASTPVRESKRRRCTDPEALAARAAYRKLRKSAGCTQVDIANATGINHDTIGNTEQGFVVSDDTWNRYWRAVVRLHRASRSVTVARAEPKQQTFVSKRRPCLRCGQMFDTTPTLFATCGLCWKINRHASGAGRFIQQAEAD